jgi:hypothetical protein
MSTTTAASPQEILERVQLTVELLHRMAVTTMDNEGDAMSLEVAYGIEAIYAAHGELLGHPAVQYPSTETFPHRIASRN